MTLIEGNKIIIPIEVLLQNKEDIREMNQEIDLMEQRTKRITDDLGKIGSSKKPSENQSIKSTIDQEVHSSAEEAAGMEIPESGIESNTAKEAEGGLGLSAVQSGLGKLSGFISSPVSSVLSIVKTAIPEIGAALLAWGIAQKVIELVYGPGGWLDVRWKRDMQKEVEGYFTRQEQQNRRVGLSQVIVSSSATFRAYNGANVENTLKEVRTFGVSRIGLQDKALGRRP